MALFDEDNFPDIHIPVSKLNEIKDWQIGRTYKVELTVEQVSASKEMGGFKIISAKDVTEPDVTNPEVFNEMMVKAKANRG